MLDGTTKDALQQLGWFLSDEGWATVCDGVPEAKDHNNPEVLHEAAMNIDIRKRGLGQLPAEIRSLTSRIIHGPLICQISEVVDISRPLKVPGSSVAPVHTCQLSDGSSIVTTVALFGDVKKLLPSTPPGTKVRLHAARVRHGILLADDLTFEVLGGTVKHLVDAWEAQAKYGRLIRASRKNIANMGPAFSHYVPSRSPQRSGHHSEGQHSVGAAQLPQEHSETSNMQHTNMQGQAAFAEQATDSQAAAAANAPGASQKALAEQSAAVPVGSRAAEAGVQAAQNVKNAVLVRQKLQDKFHGEITDPAQAADKRTPGRGRRKGGRNQRGSSGTSDGPTMMTLDDWETSQRAPQGVTGQGANCSDEELARQLQEQFDMEEYAAVRQAANQRLDTSDFFVRRSTEVEDVGSRHGCGRGQGRSWGRGYNKGRGRRR